MIRCALILLFTCACINIHAQVNIITTIGGNGDSIYGKNINDGGPAADAEILLPEGLCLDNSGNIYIAEFGNARIRKIDGKTGLISTIAGHDSIGFSGDNGPATDARFLGIAAVFIDTANDVYIADGDNHRIRKVTLSTGIITTVVGSGPVGIGNGSYSGDGGPATNATLNVPCGLYIDKYNNIYIADDKNNRIRKVDAMTNIITTIAGDGVAAYSGDGGLATNAKISDPGQPFVDSSGNIYFTETSNNIVRKVDASTGIISTVAGTGTQAYSGDGGPATDAKLNQPYGIYIDKQQNIFIAEWGNGVIRKIDANGIITTVAGNGTRGYIGDNGVATNAELSPDGVFLDQYGAIYIADFNNNRIRKVNNAVGVTPLTPKGELSIWPNPAHDELIIANAEGSEVVIYNLIGQKVFNAAVISDKEVINVSNFISGTYIVQILSKEGEVRNVRVVKE